MNIHEYLSILSTQVSITFSEYLTWSGLYESPADFLKDLDILVDEDQLGRFFDAQKQVHFIFEYHLKNKTQILYPHSTCYPACFLNLQKPPLFLMLKGKVENLNLPGISVVGSREPSSSVVNWIQTYLPYVVNQGYSIISGAARGVDLEAHLVSLRSGRPTIAFLPSGFSAIYPKDFIKYQDKILDTGGVILSEYDPFKSVLPYHFSERNRMIASLGLIVFVCEARLRSGSVMTARLAIENSKTLCVLPSFPLDTKNAGGVNLLFEGAFPIRDHRDLLALLELEKVKMGLFVPDRLERVGSNNAENTIG